MLEIFGSGLYAPTQPNPGSRPASEFSYRSAEGTPLVSPEFVAERGPSVRVVDIRDPWEFVGPLGYIPGSDWIPIERLESLPKRLGPDAPVVLVSRHGETAAKLVHRLEELGMRSAAAMSGGIVQWLSFGFTTTRDPEILDRCDVLRPLPEENPLPPAAKVSAADIEAHLGDASSIRWVKIAALVLHAQLSCVDGRDAHGVIGTPGGDAGQFLLALAAAERVLGRTFSKEAIASLIERRIEVLGGFYMHTDGNALAEAEASARNDPRFRGVFSRPDPQAGAEWRQFLRRPPIHLREAVLDHLCRPETIGCGHLRLMHLHAADYGVRTGLVLDVLRGFFHARWEGAFRADYEALDGRHDERAVINTRLEGRLHPFSTIPLISPSFRGSQMFVNHPQASEYVLDVLSDFLLGEDDLIPGLDDDRRGELTAEMRALHGVHVNQTLLHLAKGLPVFDVTFDRRGGVKVAETGVVGA